MTEQQQKLYEKLLKKVNEYCLGAAAEDVIAAIDALVDTYESKPKSEKSVENIHKCKNCSLNKYYDCEVAGCCIKEEKWEFEKGKTL